MPRSTSGYAANGNIVAYSDQVNGTWNLGYDGLNRLTSGAVSGGYFAGLQMGWGYDSFGNRTSESFAGNPSVALPTGSNTQYNANNQVSSSSLMGGAGLVYDVAGNVILDNQNRYLYDGDGRVCAAQNVGGGAVTGYIYDAEGNRVAKGTLSGFDCGSSFTETNWYVLGQSNEQLTETDGQGNWMHTNVYAAGELIATYDPAGLHFQLNDWLGTRRVETDYAGNVQQRCSNLPFGDGASNCVGPTEQFFTGQQRDAESGNDYFEARYYESNMGRFLSPDPAGPWVADISDPQSWNFYAYARNNPLTNFDPDGYDCAYLNNAGTDVDRDVNGKATGIDTKSNSGECGKNGGYWVDGTFTSGTVYSNSNNVDLNGYEAGALTSASYTSATTSTSPDLDTTPNIFAYSRLQPLPPTALAGMISSLNFSGQSNKLIGCIISHESSGEPGAGNPGSTAKGLMQVLKGGAKDVAQHGAGGTFQGMNGTQLYAHATDPAANIATGTALLKLKVGYAKGNLQNGLDMYGTGAPYGQNRLACANKP